MSKYAYILLLVLALGFVFWSWQHSSAPKRASERASKQAPAIVAYPSTEQSNQQKATASTTPNTGKTVNLQNDPNAEKFVQENAKDLWQIDPANLVFEKKDGGERVKISYVQRNNGLPIFGARLSLFVERDRLSRVQNELSLASQTDGDFQLSADQALIKLQEQQWQVEGDVEPLFYPVMQKLRPAYRVYATREGQAFDVILDAVDGRTIRKVPRQHY